MPLQVLQLVRHAIDMHRATLTIYSYTVGFRMGIGGISSSLSNDSDAATPRPEIFSTPDQVEHFTSTFADGASSRLERPCS